MNYLFSYLFSMYVGGSFMILDNNKLYALFVVFLWDSAELFHYFRLGKWDHLGSDIWRGFVKNEGKVSVLAFTSNSTLPSQVDRLHCYIYFLFYHHSKKPLMVIHHLEECPHSQGLYPSCSFSTMRISAYNWVKSSDIRRYQIRC